MALILYIGEKFHAWSSPTTHPCSDAVIASCMLYWFTGSITSSFWLYYMRKCGSQEESYFLESQVFEQPFAFGCGSHEIHWVRARFICNRAIVLGFNLFAPILPFHSALLYSQPDQPSSRRYQSCVSGVYLTKVVISWLKVCHCHFGIAVDDFQADTLL